MRKSATSKLAVVAAIATALTLLVLSPVAYAGAPNSSHGTGTASNYHDPTHQDPKWVALKNAYRIRSGIVRGEGKGAKTHPYVTSSVFALASAPSSYELSTNNPVLNTFEPGDGCSGCGHINFTGVHASYDDAKAGYSAPAFVKLCGPGATDNALWYWPNPPNLIDMWTWDQWDGVGTTWNHIDVDNVDRMRGYLMDLAWNIKAPTWSANGMMNAQPQADAVKLQVVRDALNWEASGENSSDWSNYFYYVAWYPQSSESDFHSNVVSDIYYSQVPVIPEVDTYYLPNWPYVHINHFITIIGYDDIRGIYYYTDTCANITGCGSGTNGGVNTISQSELWTAITAITYNQNSGDGGWVW